MTSCVAIVAGLGQLPILLANELAKQKQEFVVVELQHCPLKWTREFTSIQARVEQISKLCAELSTAKVDKIVFAGAMTRPQIDVNKLDELGRQLATDVLGTSKPGDDATLRYIVHLFENEGFEVVGASELLPELVQKSRHITPVTPTEIQMADMARGQEILKALGPVDVGQAAIVSDGLCLGIETIQGTDMLLQFVAQTSKSKGGVLVKMPKPEQDLRIDMPVIGPETVKNVCNAGLDGIAIQMGKVMIIEQDSVLALADEFGISIWTFE